MVGKNGNRKRQNKIVDELERKESELKERLKELNCIYTVTEIIDQHGSDIDLTLRMIAESLPPAMRYPENARARIKVDGKTYSTEGFLESDISLSKLFSAGDYKKGSIEVVYVGDMPVMEGSPFLREEEKLLRVISENLAKYLAKQQADQEVRNYINQLGNLLSAKGSSLDSMMDQGSRGEEWKVVIDLLQKTDPQTYLRICRKMLYHLAHIKGSNLEALMDTIRPDDSENEQLGANMPNPRFDLQALISVQHGIFDIASNILSSTEMMDLFVRWLKENKARPLLLVSEQSRISLKDILSALEQYMKIPESDRTLPPDLDRTIRTNLIRRFLNDRPEYLNVAVDYLTIPDFHWMLKRFIGHYQGVGGLGGKASMVFLIERIIEKEMRGDPDLENIKFARSWYLGTDVMREFIHYNALDEVVQVKYLDPSEVRKEQPFMEQIFKNGTFNPEIVSQLKEVLRDFRYRPIIVRSSSHLEDSYGAAFSGKYKSLFIPNTGTEEERLNSLMDAIAEVWASTFGPNPIEYRRERGMLDLMENMGVLIQEVVGNIIGPHFAPSYAGVALTNNEFRWSPRINRRDGILRLVMGLGTRAVDRVSNDYPLLISPMKPGIRVNTSVEDMVRYSQRYMDVINMETRLLETVSIDDIIRDHGQDYPMMKQLVSRYCDGSVITNVASVCLAEESENVVTFIGVLEKTPFLSQMRKVMKLLKEKLGTPVDIEFAHDGTDLFILQCRPQIQGLQRERITIPVNVLEKETVFRANRYITSGVVNNVEFIVIVDPSGYENLESKEDILQVAQVVSMLNVALPKRKFVLIGPGRWGSRGDIKLGVPVQYGDINNTSILIEVARTKGGYVPELSFGTHFFQDLVESNIHYLPLYPDEEGGYLNDELLEMAENGIDQYVPGLPERIRSVIKLVRTGDLSSGGSMTIVMDGEGGEALAYLTKPDHTSWRLKKVQELLSDMEPRPLGVEAVYLIGSVKENCAGPGSDIDLIVLFNGNQVQLERLEEFIRDWSERIDAENFDRTGIRTGGLIDLHVVTQQDIANGTSWASHIRSVYNPARKLDLKV